MVFFEWDYSRYDNVGKRYVDAGSVDILNESGVIAYGSINGVAEAMHNK